MREIPLYNTFKKINPIKKGMSGDKKYYIEDENGKLWVYQWESDQTVDPDTLEDESYPGYEDAPVQVLSGEQAVSLTGVPFDPSNPAPLQNIIDVSGGAFHSLALEKPDAPQGMLKTQRNQHQYRSQNQQRNC